MPRVLWSRACLAAAILAGCKSDPPSDSAQGSGAAAAPASSKAPASAVAPPPKPAPAREPMAVKGPSLSYLKSVDRQRCEWMRQPLPSGEPIPLFAFDAACSNAMISWSPQGQEGLVFSPRARKAWRVDWAARTGKPLDLKALPEPQGRRAQELIELEQVGYSREGHPVAIVAGPYETEPLEKDEEGREFLSFEGQRYRVPDEPGLPGMARAYRLEEGSWKLIEIKAGKFETDIAGRTWVLATKKAMMPITSHSLPDDTPGEAASESDAQRLDAAFPGAPEGGAWGLLATPGGKLYYRTFSEGEGSTYATVPLRWEQQGEWVALDGLLAEEREALGLVLQEGLLLVFHGSSEGFAQVWDTRTKKLRVSLESATAPAFWPGPTQQ